MAKSTWDCRGHIFPALSAIWSVFCTILVPWQSMHQPVQSLLHAEDDAKDSLTASWKDSKLGELTFVGLTGALIASVVTGSFTWPQPDTIPIATLGCWYSALIFALTSVSSATQQAVTLNRLSTYSNGLTRIRLLLASRTPSEQVHDGHNAQHNRPSFRQLYVWQTPIMFLNFSILLYIAGLMTLVFQVASQQWGNIHEKWGIEGLIFAVSVILCVIGYMFSTFCLYGRMGELDALRGP